MLARRAIQKRASRQSLPLPLPRSIHSWTSLINSDSFPSVGTWMNRVKNSHEFPGQSLSVGRLMCRPGEKVEAHRREAGHNSRTGLIEQTNIASPEHRKTYLVVVPTSREKNTQKFHTISTNRGTGIGTDDLDETGVWMNFFSSAAGVPYINRKPRASGFQRRIVRLQQRSSCLHFATSLPTQQGGIPHCDTTC